MNKPRFFLGLLHRRECVLPTWRGWILLLGVAAAAVATVMLGVCSFLAVNDPVPGGILVIEGWSPECVHQEALAEWKRNHYDKLYVTGGPIDGRSPLGDFKTCADLGVAILLRLGADQSIIQPVPSPLVVKDRSYADATALRKWLRERGPVPDKINLISLGPHSRRSRLLFQEAFAGQARVGIISIEEPGFDHHRWWVSSGGVRAIVGESIAYLYARFIFRAPKDE